MQLMHELKAQKSGRDSEADDVGKAVELPAKVGGVAGETRQPPVERIKDHRHEDEVRQQLHARQPIGRMGRPDEIAYAALYLASDEASFVTGSALVIDGGWTAK